LKKVMVLTIVMIMAVFSIVACGKKAATPKAGSADAASMLTFLPKTLNGVVLVDLHRALITEAVDKAIKDEKNAAKYQEFVDKTGIDPQKDLFFVAVGIAGDIEQKKQEAAAVINLKYNKETLLAKLKEEEKGLSEEVYSGITIYGGVETGKNQSASGAFLDESNIVIGSPQAVKNVIDVYQKKAENVLKNPEMAAVIKTVNKDAIFWTAFAFPPEAMKKLAEQNPMAKNLENIKALTIFFDYKNNGMQAEIKAAGGDEKQNKETAEMLTGLKSMGGMIAAQEPSFGELLDKIVVTSGADFVKISADIPDELIQKLKDAAQKKVESMAKPKEEPKEEVKKEQEK